MVDEASGTAAAFPAPTAKWRLFAERTPAHAGAGTGKATTSRFIPA
jgi:hypothetical protein